jgi:hypothetical protein
VAAAAHVDVHQEQLVARQPHGRALQVLHAPDEQPGADEQHEREGDLRDDERPADAEASAADAHAAERASREGTRVGAQRRREVDARGPQRGTSPTSTAVASESATVNPSTRRFGATARAIDRSVAAMRSSAALPAHAPSTPSTHAAAASRALSVRSSRTRRARPAPRARRTPHLGAPRGGAREQQVGDVRADDEQHERRGREQDRQRPAELLAHAREAHGRRGRRPPRRRAPRATGAAGRVGDAPAGRAPSSPRRPAPRWRRARGAP